MTTYAEDIVHKMTVADLRARLDQLGVEYAADAKKLDLVNLYIAAGGDEHVGSGGVIIRPEIVDNVPAVRDLETALVRPAGTTRDIADAFDAYSAVCNELLDDDDYQSIGGKRFRKKSAWRKLAVAYGVNIALVEERTERTDTGELLRVHCTVRATAPNGRAVDGLGSCDVTERKFSHLEHDVRGTAFTRAANRSCSDLFGLGEVSAEEVDGNGGTTAPAAVMPTPEEVRLLVETAKTAKEAGVDVGGPWPSLLGVKILTDAEPREPVITAAECTTLILALRHLRETAVVDAVAVDPNVTICKLDDCTEPATTDDGLCADHESF